MALAVFMWSYLRRRTVTEYMPTTEQVESGFAHDSEAEYHDPVNYGAHSQAQRRAFRRWLAEVERRAAEKARSDLMIELLPVLEDAVSNAYLCQNDRGIGDEWDDEIARAEAARDRAEAYRRNEGENA